MGKKYCHLAYEERCQIYALLKRGSSIAQIASDLGFHRSTIYREINRNSGLRGYRYKQADQKSCKRRSKASACGKKMTPDLTSAITEKLSVQWSPEQISGWLKKTKHTTTISYETIYKYIWNDKRNGGILYKHLRHSGKKYNKRSKDKAGRGCIPNRVDIKKRPAIVEKKRRAGDLEIDTIIGKGHKGAIVSIVDRASKLTKLVKVSRKTAEEVKDALINCLMPIKEFIHTITADNGKEFAAHKLVSSALKAEFYFARPYCSYERGLNEHTNGLVRQYFPKGMDFDSITEEDLQRVENLLNTRPRKVLQYRQPIEVFNHLTGRQSIVALHC